MSHIPRHEKMDPGQKITLSVNNTLLPKIPIGTVGLMAATMMGNAMSDPDVIEDLFGMFRNQITPGNPPWTPRGKRIEAISILAMDLAFTLERLASESATGAEPSKAARTR
jgi:hypothetical protein